MITIEELFEILEKRVVYDRNTMVYYSQGRTSFILCPINNREPFADIFVITNKRQNAKWEHVCTIQNMLKRGNKQYVVLLRLIVFSNGKGIQFFKDGDDDIIHIGNDSQNERAIIQILDEYSLWKEE